MSNYFSQSFFKTCVVCSELSVHNLLDKWHTNSISISLKNYKLFGYPKYFFVKSIKKQEVKLTLFLFYRSLTWKLNLYFLFMLNNELFLQWSLTHFYNTLYEVVTGLVKIILFVKRHLFACFKFLWTSILSRKTFRILKSKNRHCTIQNIWSKYKHLVKCRNVT